MSRKKGTPPDYFSGFGRFCWRHPWIGIPLFCLLLPVYWAAYGAKGAAEGMREWREELEELRG